MDNISPLTSTKSVTARATGGNRERSEFTIFSLNPRFISSSFQVERRDKVRYTRQTTVQPGKKIEPQNYYFSVSDVHCIFQRIPVADMPRQRRKHPSAVGSRYLTVKSYGDPRPPVRRVWQHPVTTIHLIKRTTHANKE